MVLGEWPPGCQGTSEPKDPKTSSPTLLTFGFVSKAYSSHLRFQALPERYRDEVEH